MHTYRDGSSRSRRAASAEAEGRLPWSRLSPEDRHGLTREEAVALGLHLDEWHHVSSRANRVEYFSPAVVAEALAGLSRDQIKGAAAIALSYGLQAYRDADDDVRAAQQIIQDRVMDLWERMEWTR